MQSTVYFGKDGYRWLSTPDLNRNARVSAADLCHTPAGLTSNSKDIKNELDAFQLFINQPMLDLILEYTNLKLDLFKQEKLNNNLDLMLAFIRKLK